MISDTETLKYRTTGLVVLDEKTKINETFSVDKAKQNRNSFARNTGKKFPDSCANYFRFVLPTDVLRCVVFESAPDHLD